MARTHSLLLAVTAAGVALAGCGTSDDRDQARATVERFYDAVRHKDGEAACRQLSAPAQDQVEGQSGRRCNEAITALDLEGEAVVGAEVWVTNAKVDLRSGESAFLGREAVGWRITALGCKPEGDKPADRPFDCEVEA
ncbi:hypothetical protein [Conexibacter sp. SYSU D00693]|uniref:hypothetical protein n=1 Tax=Conexibacter sp. SYSU D00693 TaxID=2812560 RepID=UPI00196B5342|nr:hypothetical protein [Conexibacter sp. SYSU D00693]